MKRSATIVVVVLAVVAMGLIFLLADGQAQRGRGMIGPGHMMGYGGPQYCPYCGGYLGPYGMGPNMRGWGMWPQGLDLKKPLTKKDAELVLDQYVQFMGNPYLKAGKVTEKDAYFVGEIMTEDNVLVDNIMIDKNTGWASSVFSGPGMRGWGGGYGYGMTPGMMGPGYQGYGHSPQYQVRQWPLKEEEVKAMLEHYVQSTRNPNLKVGKITEKDTYFEGEILTKDNALVDKILVNKDTGWMRSEYQ